MRFGILSDIHANLQAWNAVLSDMAIQHVDRIVCLGDIVGYGPDPAGVLEHVYRHADAMLMGNHDAAIAGRMDIDSFNEHARQAISWTASALGRRARDVLAGLPLTLTGPGFRCAHGDFSEPAAFKYIIDPPDALPSWTMVDEPLLFVGHSHRPGIFLLGASGVPRHAPPQDFEIENGKRYLVNVGSVGCPRDGDALATYCLYDDTARTVHWRRVPFDLEAFRAALAPTDLPREPLRFLDHDPRQRLVPIREQLNFSPPADKAGQARADEVTRDVMEHWRRRAGRWRHVAIGAVTVATLLAAAFGAMALRLSNPILALPSEPLDSIPLTVPAGSAANALPAMIPHPDNNQRLINWRVIRHAPKYQSLSIETKDETPRLTLNADTAARFRIEAPPIELSSDSVRLRARARFRRCDEFNGHIGLVLDIVKRLPDGREERIPTFARREPRQIRRDGWRQAQITMDFPRYTHRVQFAIDGRFEGSVEIDTISLEHVD